MTQLDIELDLCKKNFTFFVGYCYQNIFNKPFVFYDFHKRLINILLHAPELKRIIINAPPRIGKTELIKHYIAWRFLNDPSSSVIYVSYEGRLVARKNREIRDLLKWLSKHFGISALKMQPSADGTTEWVNQSQGTILARGSYNGITGSGCSTILVVDDPNKPDDRSSPAILEHRNKVFMNTIRNRINTPDVPILIDQQRVASNDLSGFLLSGGSNECWKHYNFPAINDDGTALCPERLPLDEIETYRHDPFTYNAQYLQVPLDDIGALFDKNRLVLSATRPPIKGMRLVIACDAAGKSDPTNDFNSFAVVGNQGPDYYILEIQNFRADITVLLERARELRHRYGPSVPFVFEYNNNGGAAVQLLRKEMSGILESHPNKDKVERAILVKPLFDSLNVHFALRGLVWGEVQSQFLKFPHVKHDDIVDSVVMGLTWLQNLPQNAHANTAKTERLLKRPVYGRTYGSTGYYPTRRF